MDHYQTLGVAKNATQDDIKKAYRRMASIHHPDKGGDTATFQRVQEAYDILSDPQKKQEYDNPNPFGHNPGGGFPGGFQFHMNGMNLNDIFGQFFNQGQRPQQPRMQTLKTSIWVTLEQVYNGGEQMLRFQTINGLQTVKIDVPRGVEHGANLRYDGLIPNSILIVEFRVHEHERFERRGADLYSHVDIDIFDLIVGTTVKFETISDKTLDVTVPAKTQPGNMLRIPNEGLPKKNGFGDQYILLNPFIPDTIDSSITDSILRTRKS